MVQDLTQFLNQCAEKPSMPVFTNIDQYSPRSRWSGVQASAPTLGIQAQLRLRAVRATAFSATLEVIEALDDPQKHQQQGGVDFDRWHCHRCHLRHALWRLSSCVEGDDREYTLAAQTHAKMVGVGS